MHFTKKKERGVIFIGLLEDDTPNSGIVVVILFVVYDLVHGCCTFVNIFGFWSCWNYVDWLETIMGMYESMQVELLQHSVQSSSRWFVAAELTAPLVSPPPEGIMQNWSLASLEVEDFLLFLTWRGFSIFSTLCQRTPAIFVPQLEQIGDRPGAFK